MIGIVLVTHGRLAYEMLNVAQHVVGCAMIASAAAAT